MCVSEHRDIIIYMIVYIHYYNIQGYNYTHFPPILLVLLLHAQTTLYISTLGGSVKWFMANNISIIYMQNNVDAVV